jgi:hypothetical protein
MWITESSSGTTSSRLIKRLRCRETGRHGALDLASGHLFAVDPEHEFGGS